MKSTADARFRALWLVCLAGLALVVLNALRAAPQITDLFLAADGDDQMRLVMVRDWLAGQSWFDSHQYRVLPPDGISMHWSRYLDAGLAAILVPIGWVLPAAQAELATLILWPSLLAALMVLVLSQGAGRLFGPAAAAGALAVFFGWSKLGGEFVAPRIDHHNLQILGCTVVFYLSLVPGPARRLGILAGVAMAATLAIGLEMLPVLATLWAVAALRHAFGQAEMGRWLTGFGPTFLAAAPLLLAGQTPPAEWLVPHCDELAPPVIVLGTVGTLATLVPVLAGRFLPGALSRVAAMLVVSAAGIALAYPLLGQCLAGPYAAVDPAVRLIIERNIIEALPAASLFQSNPTLMLQVLLPPVVIGVLALGTALRLRTWLQPVQAIALVQAFAVLCVGLALSAVQIRAANLMAPALPLLGGFLVHAFLQMPRQSRLRLPAVLALLLAQPVVLERAATLVRTEAPELRGRSDVAPDTSRATLNCRTLDDMAGIASLPPSILFSTLNLGPTILAFTPHSVTSAGYHRSTMAFWNGLGAFESRDILRGALIESRADYLVLCSGGVLERSSPLLQDMLAGDLPDWLQPLPGDGGPVHLLRVDKAALQAGKGQP